MTRQNCPKKERYLFVAGFEVRGSLYDNAIYLLDFDFGFCKVADQRVMKLVFFFFFLQKIV